MPTLLPGMDAVYRSLCTTIVALRMKQFGPSIPTTFLAPCRGTPEGVHPDPPTSLRFQIDGPTLWFKTTPQGTRTGWINLSSGGGGGVGTWAQVLANGASSGANNPVVEAGQTLSFGDVSVGQTAAGEVDIDGSIIPTVAANLGEDANRWEVAYLNHLVGLYVDNLPTGTTLDNQYVIDSVNGDDFVLPTAAENGSIYIVRNRDGVLTSTLTPQPGQTIEGAASLVLNPGNAYMLVADGTTTWRAIGMATGGGVVTLQAAITNQGAVPTTQITNTNIQLGDTTAWVFADAIGNPILGIFGNDSPNAIEIEGGQTVANAGQGIIVLGGVATAPAQGGGPVSIVAGAGNTTGTGGAAAFVSGAGGATGAGGTIAITTGAGGATSGGSGALTLATGTTTDGATGSVSIATANALGTNQPAGDISILGGSSTGTAEGADVNVTAGVAGATGTGGDLVFAAGAGGSVSGAGGDVGINGGGGGATGTGGAVTITTGTGGTVSGDSGALTLATSSTTDGATGSISITTANATGTNRAAGDVTILGGSSTGSAEGADISITTGAGGATGTGGDLSLVGGAGGSTSGAGGDISVAGGTATDGDGGDISLAGGAAVGTNRTGGQLTLVAGGSTGNAISAPITLQAGTSSGTGTGGRISLIAGAGATGGSAGGSVILSGGAATGAANDGGSISVLPGAATGAGINGRLVVAPVWTGDGPMMDFVGNGANGGSVSLHSGSRAGGPNGVVASAPGSFYGYNGSGSAIAGTGYLNVGTTASSTVWAEILTAGAAGLSLAGLPGNAYANLVGYVDASDRNSYSGTGAVVRDIMGNGTAGVLATATLVEGAFSFNGASGSVSLTKNASLNNIFAAGGTILAFIRPASSGEGGFGRIADTTQSADAGWFLSSFSDAASRQSIEFQRNFSGSAGGTWTANNITNPISGTSVRPVDLGTWSAVAVTYNDSSAANDPTMYVNGELVANTESVAPVGAAVTDAGNALVIGNRSDDAFTFNGQIGIVLLFTRVLTQNEIRTIYNDFGRRYGLGQGGWTSTVERGQSVYIQAGSSSQASTDADGGDVFVKAGDTSAGSSAPDAGSVVIRAGDVTGVVSGRSGNLVVLAGGVTNSGSGALAGSAEFGCGVHGNGNAAGTCTIHGGDNSDQGNGGTMIVRGGDCITATATSDGGGQLALRAGNSRNGSVGADAFFASGGVGGTGTAASTGDITISTQRTALGPFPLSGGTDTDTGNISILTANPGATASDTGNITIQCGNVAAVTGANPGDIVITAGSATNTSQANVTAGNVTITAGTNAGASNSIGGSVTLVGGNSSGTGANAGTGGDVIFTGGTNSHNSAASRGGSIQGTAGAGLGTNTSGGSVSFTAGASTGTGTAGSASLTAGAGAAAATGGTAAIAAGAGGATSGIGGTVTVTGGAGGGTGSGGAVTISGGAAGATGAAGGTATVQGGAATDGNGGGVSITGRNATGTNRTGGTVQISAGDATGSGTGGAVTALAGSGGATGTAGNITMTAGAGGSTSGAGGSATVQGGVPVDGNGGGVSIIGRAGIGTNRTGGSVALTGGASTGSGTGGHIDMTPGTAASSTSASGMARALGAFAFAAPNSPATLSSGTTNDYAAAGNNEANVLRITPDAAAGSALGGLVGGQNRDGRTLLIFNIGTNSLGLINEGGGSTDVNRFALPSATNITILAGGGVMLWYDNTTQRWRAVLIA